MRAASMPLLRVLTAVAAVALAAHAHAAGLAPVLANYTLTTWSQRDGLPAGTVWAMAQDREGYLWIGADAGLYRFDGFRFTAADALGISPLPHVAVRALYAQPDGTLWVGLEARPSIVRVSRGTLHAYSDGDAGPLGDTRTFLRDADGTLWAGTSRGLFHLAGDQWLVARDTGLPAGTIFTSYLTRSGDVVVGTNDGVYRRPRGATRFTAVEVFGYVDGGVRGIAEDPNGHLIATDLKSGFRHVAQPARRASDERGRGTQLLADRRGRVWVGTGGQGLWRISFDENGTTSVQEAAAITGPQTDGIFSLLEDRDGNLWAGTSDGLNRLTPHRVEGLTSLGIVAGVDSTPQGSVWVSTFDGLLEFTRHGSAWQPPRRYLENERIRALHADREGRVWFATNDMVGRFDPGRDTPVVVMPRRKGREVESITSDKHGRIWLVISRRGLVRIDADGVLTDIPLPLEVRNQAIQMTHTAGDNHVWLAVAGGDLVRVAPDGTVRRFGAEHGASAGEYRAVYEEADGTLWFGGRNGLSRFSGGAFVTALRSPRFPADWVKAILQDRHGDLWLGTNAGIVRVSRDEFDRAVAGRPEHSRYLLLDKLDGLAGPPRLLGDRTAARSGDDRLWFVTGRGLTVVNPADHAAPPPQPRAQIVSVTADGQSTDPTAAIALGAGTSRLEIEYSALNLTTPHKTQFRYRLEGFDTEWVNAASRRVAFYTNLPPGRYRFQVIASANGLWDDAGAAWTFGIEPYFYQTRTFALASLASLLLGAWALWRLRVAQMRRQFAIILGERLRLSREIHDTLLQGIVGVAVQCDALANVSDTPVVRDGLKRLRRRVEEYIREFRQSIWDLRSPVLEEHDFDTALRMTVERVTAATDVLLEVTTSGAPVQPRPNVEQQLLRIAHEATSNAVRHACASRIRMRLHYGSDAISLRVSDDGRGFVPDAAAAREADGHCGLVAMKERARTIGGELFIRSTPGQGTEIEAVVPLAPARLRAQVAAS